MVMVRVGTQNHLVKCVLVRSFRWKVVQARVEIGTDTPPMVPNGLQYNTNIRVH